MSSPFLLLYQDAIEHCRQFLEIRGIAFKSAGQFHSLLRRAVQSAYRETLGRRTWRYTLKLGQVNLVAPYSTGTLAYDHTGGTHERQLTLTDGVWPSWAVYGTVRFGDVNYKVEDRKSDTVLVLDTQVNPGADVASGTEYVIFRSNYTLPADFVRMGTPNAEEDWGSTRYVEPDEFLLLERQGYTTGDPTLYTIARDPALYGSLAVFLWPAPASAQTWQFLYHSRGREMRFSGYDDGFTKGVISTTEGSTTISGKGTEFSSDMIGAVLRISDNKQDLPTGIDGVHPRVDERTIIDVTDSDTMTVDTGVNSDRSDVKYTISDVVDIDPSMATLLLRACEKQLSLLFPLKDAKQIDAAWREAYVLAAEEDKRILQRQSPADERNPVQAYEIIRE